MIFIKVAVMSVITLGEICKYICISNSTHTYTHTNRQTDTQIFVYTCVYMYICMYVYICTYIYYIYVHINTPTQHKEHRFCNVTHP